MNHYDISWLVSLFFFISFILSFAARRTVQRAVLSLVFHRPLFPASAHRVDAAQPSRPPPPAAAPLSHSLQPRSSRPVLSSLPRADEAVEPSSSELTLAGQLQHAGRIAGDVPAAVAVERHVTIELRGPAMRCGYHMGVTPGPDDNVQRDCEYVRDYNILVKTNGETSIYPYRYTYASLSSPKRGTTSVGTTAKPASFST